MFNAGLVVNLCDISESHLQSGDFYLLLSSDTAPINLPSTENLSLVLKFFAAGKVHSHIVPPECFEELFTEDFIDSLIGHIGQDVILQNVLCSSNRG